MTAWTEHLARLGATLDAAALSFAEPAAEARAATEATIAVPLAAGVAAQHAARIGQIAQREQGGGDKLLIVGGVIPEEDQRLLHEAGVARIFTMGADTREIVDYLNAWRGARDAA